MVRRGRSNKRRPPVPEYPDIIVYLERLNALLLGQALEQVRIVSPFLLRSVDPPIQEVVHKKLIGFQRLGKQIVFAFEDKFYLIFHLMVAGRFHWRALGAAVPAKVGLAGFDFPNGTLLLTEAGTKKRASLHLIRGEFQLLSFDAGGLDVLTASFSEFKARLRSENHTLKRALTDPHLFSGIGNTYSDEILHRARLSPVMLTSRISDAQIEQLYQAAQTTLIEWVNRLRAEAGDGFPEKVTAFRADMAVHGRFGKPCPVCGTIIQRIRYAENETNYCPTCQTSGRLLADRSLSRLLRSDWPKNLDELEAHASKFRGAIERGRT